MRIINEIKKNRLIRLFICLKKYAVIYSIGLLALSSTNFVFTALSAVAVKGLTDACITKDSNALIKSLIFTVSSLGLVMIISPFMGYLFNQSVKKATGDLRNKLFNHIQHLPISYMENQHSGDLLSRLNNDISAAENAYGNQLMMICMAIFSGVGSGIMMFIISWKIGIIAIGFGLINTLINTLFIKQIRKVSSKIQMALSCFNQRLSDTLAGIKVVKIFDLYSVMEIKCTKANKDIKEYSMRRIKINSTLNSLNSFLGLMTFIGLIVIGGIMVINNQLSFGVLMAEILLLNGLLWMFNSIGGFITQVQTSLAGAERVFEILDMDVEKQLKFESSVIDKSKGVAVEFNNVNFSYREKLSVLDNVNIEVKNNSMVAIVGYSGCGKSTLFKLILGLYKAGSGNIKIFNKPIGEYNLYELRKLIAYVSQDSYLFNGTIAENIGYGRDGASMDEVIEACKGANIYDFIMSLPNEYETQVGEGGNHLSGGQKQRMAIARALLKDAPILLLDEATSALDSNSEQLIQKALDKLMIGRSTLVIAHRLSTVKSADTIYLMEDGKIAEQGKHEDLLLKAGIYKSLYDMSNAT